LLTADWLKAADASNFSEYLTTSAVATLLKKESTNSKALT
jgi:hypothetical protein